MRVDVDEHGCRCRTSACSTRLMMPIFGLASRIHATVNRMPGMMSGMIESAKNSVLNGVLVRSFIHASAVPSDEREQRGADRELQRVPEEPRGLGAAVGLAVVVERELRRRARRLRREEALPQQEHRAAPARARRPARPARRSRATSNRARGATSCSERGADSVGHRACRRCATSCLASPSSDRSRRMVALPRLRGRDERGLATAPCSVVPPRPPLPRKRGREQTERGDASC